MPILPSLDQQLRSAREASGESFMWALIDVCLGCYLHDHHNRDGELMLGVTVDGSMTVNQVLDDLITEFNCVAWDLGESRLGYDHDKARAALDRLYSDNLPNMAKTFDPSLEVPDEDEDFDGLEPCQAWFLLTWDLPE